MEKSDNILNVFTDGSFRRKYNYCGYGVYFPNNEIKSYGHEFKLEPLTTSPSTELITGLPVGSTTGLSTITSPLAPSQRNF